MAQAVSEADDLGNAMAFDLVEHDTSPLDHLTAEHRLEVLA
jgi:hypothetical protein